MAIALIAQIVLLLLKGPVIQLCDVHRLNLDHPRSKINSVEVYG